MRSYSIRVNLDKWEEAEGKWKEALLSILKCWVLRPKEVRPSQVPKAGQWPVVLEEGNSHKSGKNGGKEIKAWEGSVSRKIY